MTRRVSARFAGLICRLYPPSWRERYGEEYASVLGELEASPRVVLDAVVGAADAWVSPGGIVLRGRARLRASLSVAWAAWIVLAAGALIFGQSTEDPPFHHANTVHPLAGLVYGIYEWCAHLSVAAVLLAGLPLAGSLITAARAQRRTRVIALVIAPVIAPLWFLGVLVLITHAVTRSRTPGVGVGPAWFGVLVILGLVAAAACAAGPLMAMRRVWPSDRALTWALRASLPALALMSCSAVASVAYELALGRVDSGFAAGFGRPWWQITPYALVMGGACAAAITSVGRGVRADRVRS